MKTTIIELLNKIANGEEPPKTILFKNLQWSYDKKEKDYVNIFNEWLFDSHVISNIVNCEVEILKTTITYKPDKIEKIIPTSLKGINNLDDKIEIAHIDTISAMDKINEIIDKVNNL